MTEVALKLKPTKTNLTSQERVPLTSLCQDKSVHIFMANKGNTSVVMDNTDYDQKVQSILESEAHSPLPKDPTPPVEKEK